MPLYFVDSNDGHTEVRDDVGSEAANPEAARDEAVRLLTEVARSGVVYSSEQLLIATVRDGANQNLYRLVLALTCSQPGQEAQHGRAM